MSTSLYREQIVQNDGPYADLMREVWASTPWIISAFTGSSDDSRERQILDWCYGHFGDQAFPIHGRPGTWHRGGATIYGWTWLGFATEDQMKQFLAAWPHEELWAARAELATA